MRADGARNRRHIIDTARTLLAAKGTGVTLRAVARRAGVGTATVTRHFPTRDALVDAATARQLELCTELTDGSLADPDPWHGLLAMVDRVFDPEARRDDLPVTHLMAESRAARNVCELARRAQEAGHLRADFEPNDLLLLVKAGESLASTSPHAARRLAAYLLQSFAARTGPLPSAEPIHPLTGVPHLTPGPGQTAAA
ncbi:AcrR family transcriptional regulator [Catenuloplanes nepalensis]|uniref:AcrR family transcriptional regulator n=1 Tax=Catenuloplanes nepalensis TaxID=587533 RepID=A0ABT9MN58_9ACTN|nr:TetR/AcrR family transcriptional regulator [Catenuloplanes nepalensis]MDP9792820.1 AcrR family transcriptional regulator [Catenuloplanes nepalensis]